MSYVVLGVLTALTVMDVVGLIGSLVGTDHSSTSFWAATSSPCSRCGSRS
jgi:hypothetical protein